MNPIEVPTGVKTKIHLHDRLARLHTLAHAILHYGESDMKKRRRRELPEEFSVRFHEREAERLRHEFGLPVVYHVARGQLHNNRWIRDDLIPAKEVRIWPPTTLGNEVTELLKETPNPATEK